MQVSSWHHICHTCCACLSCSCHQMRQAQCSTISAACYCRHDRTIYVQTAADLQRRTGAGRRVEHCAVGRCRSAQLQHCSTHCACSWTVHQVTSVWCPCCACSGRGDLHYGVTRATGCCRIAPVSSLAALQDLHPQQAACSDPRTAESLLQSCETAGSSSALPALAAACRRLIHGRAATGEPATSAASAATRHPLPAFTADEGLTAAAAEAAQVEVATADSPPAIHPGTATDGSGSGHRASTAGAETPATRPPTAAGRQKPAKRAPAAKDAKASVRGSNAPREWRPNSRLPPVDYTPDVESAVLAFWRRRGLLLAEAAVTDAAAAGEQRLLRRRVLRFAQKSSHHRDVPQLEQRLARWDAAKAEMQCVSTLPLAPFLSMCHYHNNSMLFCLLGSRQCSAHRRGH
jgi:hypothetical protein